MNASGGCPGSRMRDFRDKDETKEEVGNIKSQLRQWPIQMHLISPTAPYFQGADVALTADCVAYALGGFHNDYLKGKSIGIACPKIDQNQDVYIEKICSWINDAKINTLTVIIMQVPCCMGLVRVAQTALQKAKRKIPVKSVIIGVTGDVIREEWIST